MEEMILVSFVKWMAVLLVGFGAFMGGLALMERKK